VRTFPRTRDPRSTLMKMAFLPAKLDQVTALLVFSIHLNISLTLDPTTKKMSLPGNLCHSEMTYGACAPCHPALISLYATSIVPGLYTACCTTIPPAVQALHLDCYMPSTIARTVVRIATVPYPIQGHQT